jgi:hypothetical protein
VKEGYDGRSLRGRGSFFWGGGSILRGRIYFCGRFLCGDLWCEEFDFGGFW